MISTSWNWYGSPEEQLVHIERLLRIIIRGTFTLLTVFLDYLVGMGWLGSRL
jgi:hypothetical protein